MNWFKRKHQEVITPEVFAIYLLRITRGIIKDTSKTLEKQIDAAEHSKLRKVEAELFYFFVFALEYWWTTNPTRTEEERLSVRQAFEARLAKIISLETLQERLIAYDQIVNENKGEHAMSSGFALKLSESCDIPDVLFLVLVPDLFTKASESLSAFASVQLKLR